MGENYQENKMSKYIHPSEMLNSNEYPIHKDEHGSKTPGIAKEDI
jgi:hypothetical protein